MRTELESFRSLEPDRGVSRTLRRTRRLQPLLAFVVGFGAMAAYAEDSGSSETGVDQSKIYEEIVVTARFRSETVQDIGGAVSALDNTSIERAGITDFEDIAARIPGLNLNDRGPNQNDVGIRGVANGALQGLADTGLSGPLVSQFLDDVPMAQSTASQRDF